jgi:hypothetical protein
MTHFITDSLGTNGEKREVLIMEASVNGLPAFCRLGHCSVSLPKDIRGLGSDLS